MDTAKSRIFIQFPQYFRYFSNNLILLIDQQFFFKGFELRILFSRIILH